MESKGMSSEPDVAFKDLDQAFQLAIDLADHILENANAYHVIAGEKDFAGKGRIRFALLLVMFEEVGKLMTLVQECEKAAKADYPSVRIENYHNNCLNGRKAAAQIFEELRTVEIASLNLGKKAVALSVEPSFIKEDFCALKEGMLYLDLEGKKGDLVPQDELMDRYANIIERNAISAGEYLHDLAKALGLWRGMERKKTKMENASEHAVRYR
jgi:hypothetical protein